MFPTRIRYSGVSLPYHIGNGWFGGFLPATVFAIVAATGNIYSGLWYPIAIAAMSFVVGLSSCPKPKTATSHASEASSRKHEQGGRWPPCFIFIHRDRRDAGSEPRLKRLASPSNRSRSPVIRRISRTARLPASWTAGGRRQAGGA